jgi:hypothetical protein
MILKLILGDSVYFVTPSTPRRGRFLPALLALAALVGCEETSTEPFTPETRTFSVDASTDWVYVDLADEPSVVTPGNAATSAGWDIAFQATAVKLNGGESGGGVAGHCLCANAGAPAEAIRALTPATELGAFEAVTAAAAPRSGAWILDSAEPGGVFKRTPWYRYNLAGQHQVWPTYDVYLIRTDGEVYKVQITGYYDAEGNPRHITFRSARIDG